MGNRKGGAGIVGDVKCAIMIPMNNNTTIHISSGTMFRVVLIGLLFVALYFLRDLALVLLASVVIASAVEPGYQMVFAI